MNKENWSLELFEYIKQGEPSRVDLLRNYSYRQ